MKKLFFFFGVLLISIANFAQGTYPLTIPEIQQIWAPRYMPSVKDLDSTWSAIWNKSTNGIPLVANTLQTLTTSSNFSVTTISRTAVPGLITNTLTAGQKYIFHANLYTVTTTTVGIFVSLFGTATATNISGSINIFNNSTGAFITTFYIEGLNFNSIYLGNAMSGYTTIDGSITIATAGTLGVYIGTGDALVTGTAAVLNKSSFIVKRQ